MQSNKGHEDCGQAVRADAPRVRDDGVEKRHTEGPWFVADDRMTIGARNGPEVVWIARASMLPCIGGHSDVCAQRACDQEQANARAMAATPQLLDACVQAEAVLSIVEPRSDKAEYLRILGVVRAAIAKAVKG